MPTAGKYWLNIQALGGTGQSDRRRQDADHGRRRIHRRAALRRRAPHRRQRTDRHHRRAGQRPHPGRLSPPARTPCRSSKRRTCPGGPVQIRLTGSRPSSSRPTTTRRSPQRRRPRPRSSSSGPPDPVTCRRALPDEPGPADRRRRGRQPEHRRGAAGQPADRHAVAGEGQGGAGHLLRRRPGRRGRRPTCCSARSTRAGGCRSPGPSASTRKSRTRPRTRSGRPTAWTPTARLCRGGGGSDRRRPVHDHVLGGPEHRLPLLRRHQRDAAVPVRIWPVVHQVRLLASADGEGARRRAERHLPGHQHRLRRRHRGSAGLPRRAGHRAERRAVRRRRHSPRTAGSRWPPGRPRPSRCTCRCGSCSTGATSAAGRSATGARTVYVSSRDEAQSVVRRCRDRGGPVRLSSARTNRALRREDLGNRSSTTASQSTPRRGEFYGTTLGSTSGRSTTNGCSISRS